MDPPILCVPRFAAPPDVLFGIQSASTVTRSEHVMEAVRSFLEDVLAEG